MNDSSNDRDRQRQGVRPGAILRAMGAAAEAVSPAEFPAADLRGAAPAHESGAPHVQVVRDGNRVLKILAHCRCGEVLAIDCDYEDAATSSENLV